MAGPSVTGWRTLEIGTICVRGRVAREAASGSCGGDGRVVLVLVRSVSFSQKQVWWRADGKAMLESVANERFTALRAQLPKAVDWQQRFLASTRLPAPPDGKTPVRRYHVHCTFIRVIQSVATLTPTCRAVRKPNVSPTFTSQSQALPYLAFWPRR